MEHTHNTDPLPRSIAIAGAWGYIGRRFLNAALQLGITPYVFDPGPVPKDLPAGAAHILTGEDAFYALDSDLFHLALHPDMRLRALTALFARSAAKPGLAILCEKPIAPPNDAALCDWIASEVTRTGATVYFDFPELFDPITLRIHAFLRTFAEVRFTEIEFIRSKDREDPANPRNYKIMVPIQFQETVHCLAFLLAMLAIPAGGALAPVCRDVCAQGRALPYTPPNPEAYPTPVDGRFEGSLALNGVTTRIVTDFTAGAPWRKTRRICGTGDGQPFTIEASYLEGAKYLRINGVDQGFPNDGDSYQGAIRQLWQWHTGTPHAALMTGAYPNTAMAVYAYRLSHLLWQSSVQGKPLHAAAL